MKKQREKWLSYYKNHDLESAATIFATNENIFFGFVEKAFKESKNIDNKRERKQFNRNTKIS